MFSGVNLKRVNDTTVTIANLLKLPNFYSLAQEEKNVEWQKIAQYPVVSAHRQFGFDFNTIEKVSVISVKINQRQWLYNRVKQIHYKQKNFAIGNPILQQLRLSLPETHLDKIIETDYNSWTKNNVLMSDDILDFEMLLDDSIYDWCRHRNLDINEEHLKIIRSDTKKYQ